MPSPNFKANIVRPLKAWEGVSSWEGVRTRHRSAKMESLAMCPSQSLESLEVSPTKENRVQRSQPQEEGITGNLQTISKRGPKSKRGTCYKVPTRRPLVITQRQSSLTEPEVTPHDQEASEMPGAVTISQGIISKPAVGDEIRLQENGGQEQMAIFYSPERAPRLKLQQQESWGHHTVLEPELPEHMPIPPIEHDDHNTCDDNTCENKSFSPPDSSSDSEMDEDDTSSDISVTSGQEAIDQLKAINEDLRSEGRYYRLMAEIALKTAVVRHMRSPIVPSTLPPDLYGLYQLLMSDGVKVPNGASDRARVVADVIKLHLSWEIAGLRNSINPSAAVNGLVEFAALFVPQIQDLAIAEFVGGEETNEVRDEISAIVLNLVCWIVEQSVAMAEFVTPQNLTNQAAGWYEEGSQALRDLDACLEAAHQQKMYTFPEARGLETYFEAAGLYSARIMDWAFEQLTWVNKMAGRLERKVDMVPAHHGFKVHPFGITREALMNYIRHAQCQNQVAKQLREIEDTKACYHD